MAGGHWLQVEEVSTAWSADQRPSHHGVVPRDRYAVCTLLHSWEHQPLTEHLLITYEPRGWPHGPELTTCLESLLSCGNWKVECQHQLMNLRTLQMFSKVAHICLSALMIVSNVCCLTFDIWRRGRTSPVCSRSAHDKLFSAIQVYKSECDRGCR